VIELFQKLAYGLGLCDGGEIRERQPNLCTKAKLKTELEPLFVSPTIAKPM
jgi:hypothetical protein